MAITVEVGSRLHFGFLNLSPRRDRLYGSVGAGVDRPAVRLRVGRADAIECDNDEVASFAATAASVLDVPGAAVEVLDRPPRHVGFGSGTQLALATFVGIARSYDRPVDVRAAAPQLGRGGRSGIGVATFEGGGFVLDAGHERPDELVRGPPAEWEVPPVALRRPLPQAWRFVAVVADVEPRVHGSTEDRSIERVLRSANPAISDRIASVVVGELLPALATDDVDRFGRSLSRIDRLNGLWFRGEQSDAYHPAVGPVVEALEADPAITGVGQSSWGPAVYGVTTEPRIGAAERAARRGLDEADLDGEVLALSPRNEGAAIIDGNNQRKNINLLHSGEGNEWTE